MKNLFYLFLILNLSHAWAWKKYGIDYVIPAKKHDVRNLKGGLFWNNTLKMEVSFNESARYYTASTSNQGDINKLFGFSDCWSPHHHNSARVGWRWFRDELQLLNYVYVDGKRLPSKVLKVMNFYEKSLFEIKVVHSTYQFIVNNNLVYEESRGCDSEKAFGYRLYPYFGGDETSPRDITIYLRRL